jgi:murein DD-endopeptidase MepM/ murein hydrolase activator NlpD
MPDSETVYSPSATDFNVKDFVMQAGGRLSTYREWLKTYGSLSGPDLVAQVALENSINPRLLLALLEYQSGWVYGQPATQDQEDYPLGLVDLNQKGLYHQVVWAVNQLSIGYYAWREGRLTTIEFSDGVNARLAPDLNAGTVALQYYFAQLYQGQKWLDTLDPDGGFLALYKRMYGDPWERAKSVEPLFPPEIMQPPLTLPFTRNWTWSYTGGPHGAWERDGAYAAIDFGPGSVESGCVKSDAWVTASARGMVTRSGNGVVVLDLDADGREQTGWVLLYLHVSAEDRIPVGEFADLDDQLGHPSCEGGISTGTHLHIARKYNGEWIPADGPLPFNLGGWVVHAGDAAYKGTMVRNDVTVTACTCSNAASFVTRTDADP